MGVAALSILKHYWKMPLPRVSVVICVYNGAQYVGHALDSVFAQGFDGMEVIVVDDGSTDTTPQVLEGYGDRVRVIRQDNRGEAAARNTGVEASRARYTAFLDADDVWLPGRLEKTVAALDSEPNAVLAYADAVAVDERDHPLAATYVPARPGPAAVTGRPAHRRMVADPANNHAHSVRSVPGRRRLPRTVQENGIRRLLVFLADARAGTVCLFAPSPRTLS